MNVLLSLALIILPYGDDDHSNKNKNGNDCYRAKAECQDNDASPSFEDSPVRDSFNPTICLPFSRCELPEDDPEDEPVS